MWIIYLAIFVLLLVFPLSVISRLQTMTIGIKNNKAFPIILLFFTATDTQQVMKREPIFPQHFHNNFICREGKGNKAPKMAFKTL